MELKTSFSSEQVLELQKGVSQEEIRSRYRELSKKWHPDKFLGEVEKEEAHVRSEAQPEP